MRKFEIAEENKNAIVDFAEKIAMEVFSPDYYKGPWDVIIRNKRKKCTNYSTAVAWCGYLRRNYSDGWTAAILASI